MKDSIQVWLLALFLVAMPLSDASSQWSELSFPTKEELHKIRFVNETTGWVIGTDFIYKTIDGGRTWEAQEAVAGKTGWWGYALCPISETVILYASLQAKKSQLGIRRSTDGGKTWTQVTTTPFYCLEIEFVNDQIGYAAGGDTVSYKPVIQKTVDGGATWRLASDQFSPAKNEITGISFINEQIGWAITYDGYVFQSIDGGSHWSCIDSIRTTLVTGNPPMRDIEFVTADSGWAIGGIAGGMTIARTVTGGKGWIIDVHGGSSLREVHFVTSKIGWICGESNAHPFIAKTIDGGLSWEDQTPQINGIVGVQSISIVNQSMGYAAAHKSIHRIPIVLTMSNPVSVDPNRDHLTRPNRIVLLPNYPNPFNPDTRIDYVISTSGDVSLKIYNVNGEEIVTLVSGHQQPGAQSVHWDGRDDQGRMMPSGIYICRLKAGDVVLARKMSLVR